MKRTIQIFSSLFFSLMILTSCIFMEPSLKGNGNVVEETRKTGSFDEIKVSRGMNVYISQGDETKVLVKADENLLDVIETRLEGNTLKITSKQNIRKATTKKVFVTTPNISSIKSSAGSNVYSETVLRTRNLSLSGSSGSNMKLNVSSEKMVVTVSSGSNIKLDGTTGSFSGKASSGSNLKAEELNSKDCSANVSSGANIWIGTKNNFEGEASSGGNIYYYGNPEFTDIKKSSGGNVIKK